jgi:hypothetical protein
LSAETGIVENRRQDPGRNGLFSIDDGFPVREDWMVVEAVGCEPVSALSNPDIPVILPRRDRETQHGTNLFKETRELRQSWLPSKICKNRIRTGFDQG